MRRMTMRFPFDLAALAARAVFIMPFARRRNPSITPQRRHPLVFIDLQFFLFSLFFQGSHVQYEISFHRSMHMAACGCVQVQPSRGRKKKNGWKNTHSCEPPDNFFCKKIPTVSQRQNSSSPSNSQSTARRCVALGSLDRRVWSGLDPGVELDLYQVPLRSFAASCWPNRRKLVSQRLFFLFFFIFSRNFVPNI